MHIIYFSDNKIDYGTKMYILELIALEVCIERNSKPITRCMVKSKSRIKAFEIERCLLHHLNKVGVNEIITHMEEKMQKKKLTMGYHISWK